MQFKKDEIRERLLEAGEDEFFNHGFKGASVRGIAKAAGTTLGNFYNYFANKEELFNAVTESELKNFNEFISSHSDEEVQGFDIDEENPVVWYKILGEFTGIFTNVFTRKFYVWVSRSEGTHHHNSREIVIDYIKEHFLGHAAKSGTGIPELEKTSLMLANEFLDGVLYILKNHSERAVIEQLLRNHMLFFFMGTLGVIKGSLKETDND